MKNIENIIGKYEIEIILGLTIGIFLLLILSLVALIKISKIKKKNKKIVEIMEFSSEKNIEDSILKVLNTIPEFNIEINRIDKTMMEIKESLSRAYKNIGLVKFNAFDNIGAELSFSMALLDDHLNGIVITSIYGNDKSNMYGKKVENGKAEKHISEEEDEAIKKAISQKR